LPQSFHSMFDVRLGTCSYPFAADRQRLGLEVSLYQIPQIPSITLFETAIFRTPRASECGADLSDPDNQLSLFDS
jgi:hypothetical protein